MCAAVTAVAVVFAVAVVVALGCIESVASHVIKDLTQTLSYQ